MIDWTITLPKIIISSTITYHHQPPFPQEENMIFGVFGLWEVALLFVTIFLSAFTICNTRNLIIILSFTYLSISIALINGSDPTTELQLFQKLFQTELAQVGLCHSSQRAK